MTRAHARLREILLLVLPAAIAGTDDFLATKLWGTEHLAFPLLPALVLDVIFREGLARFRTGDGPPTVEVVTAPSRSRFGGGMPLHGA
jgi:hypothetical protein